MAGILKVGTITTPSGSGSITIPSGVTMTGQNYPAFLARLSASQSLSAGVFTKLQFNTEYYDTDNVFDSTTNYRFTVPSGKAGKYFVYYGLMVQTGSTLGYANSRIYKNGSATGDAIGQTYNYPNSGNGISQTLSAVWDLSEGDYLEAYARSNIATSALYNDGCYFGAYRIGA